MIGLAPCLAEADGQRDAEAPRRVAVQADAEGGAFGAAAIRVSAGEEAPVADPDNRNRAQAIFLRAGILWRPGNPGAERETNARLIPAVALGEGGARQ